MPDVQPQALSLEDVRHVAMLARLRLDDEQLERYRRELSSVLEHIGRLAALNVEDVEPMAHPLDLVNRLDDDTVEPALPLAQLLELAPATEGDYLAVPKVLE